jgi:predicted RNA-binding Zn ribbon-like protein
MAESSVTLALEIANTEHGPEANLGERPRIEGRHDHLRDPREARAYLAARGFDVPDDGPTELELDGLRALRATARAVIEDAPDELGARLEHLLSGYLYRLAGDGSLVPVGSGWERLIAEALPGLLELAASPEKVRTCGNSGCDWLFIDRSRNHSRRWCDMGACGSRAKMQRYRQGRRGPGDRRDVRPER